MLPDWKAVRKSLKRVHSQVLQNVQLRVDLAFIAASRPANAMRAIRVSRAVVDTTV